MARRGATDLSGILAIDKPAGMTSHDVVSVVRRATGERRIGHAGTLDPMATGVLVVLVGPATRLAPYLTAAEKSYDARIVFGTETATDDADGAVVTTLPVPRELRNEDGAIAHVAALVGTHQQIPPAFSALKRDGVTAHRAARSGEPLDLEARTIEVTDAVLLGVEPGPPVAWNISLTVSKGTYVRALARDLGRELGTVAHLGGLRRTRSGMVSLRDAIPLSVLQTSDSPGAPSPDPELVRSRFMPVRDALGIPVAEVNDTTADEVAAGRSLRADALGITQIVDGLLGLSHEGRLLGLYSNDQGTLRPAVVFPGGVS